MNRWRCGLALVLLAMVSALVLARGLAPGMAFSAKDAGGLFLGIRGKVVACYEEGRLPLWDRAVGCGVPLLADPISHAFYPGNLFFFLGGPVRGQKFFILLHLFLSGWMLAWLAREFGAKASGSWVGALFFVACGPVVSAHWSPPWNAGLPWVLAAMASSRRMLAGRGGLGWLVFAVAMSVLIGAFELLLAFGVYLVALAVVGEGEVATSRREWWVGLVGRLGWLGLAVVLGLGLGAVQIVPTFELWRLSGRGAGGMGSLAGVWSLGPERFLEMLAPGLFGTPVGQDLWMLTPPPSFANQPYLSGVYLGVPALALAWAGWRRSRGRPRFFWGGICLVTTLLALGKSTLVFDAFTLLLPGFGSFRYPSKIFIFTMVPLAVLVALGFDGVAGREAVSRRWMARGAGALMSVLAVCGAAGWWWREPLAGSASNSPVGGLTFCPRFWFVRLSGLVCTGPELALFFCWRRGFAWPGGVGWDCCW